MDKIYIVMDFIEHDLKSLMESMQQPFLAGVCVRACVCARARARVCVCVCACVSVIH